MSSITEYRYSSLSNPLISTEEQTQEPSNSPLNCIKKILFLIFRPINNYFKALKKADQSYRGIFCSTFVLGIAGFMTGAVLTNEMIRKINFVLLSFWTCAWLVYFCYYGDKNWNSESSSTRSLSYSIDDIEDFYA